MGFICQSRVFNNANGREPSTPMSGTGGSNPISVKSNGKQSGPRIGMEKGPLAGIGIGLSR